MLRVDCVKISFTRHAFQRMFERGISSEVVRAVVADGDVIEAYPGDAPYPSSLILGFAETRPVHAVVARDPASGECFVVTVYEPDASLWTEDFRRRR